MGDSIAQPGARKSYGTGSFSKMPRAVVNSQAFHNSTGNAIKLLNQIAEQYNGDNNGDLSAAYSVLSRKGWRSQHTLTNALCGLLRHGLIEKTRHGSKARCALFAITWESIDECNGKHDVRPGNKPSRKWTRKPQK